MKLKLKRMQEMSLTGKRVLVRVDYNVPMKNGKVTDATRISETLPTLKHLIEKNAKIVLISHLGRPEGKRDPQYSLKAAAAKLEELIGIPVLFVEDCAGESVESAVASLKPSGIALLENLRFHPGEEGNEGAFADRLARHGDLFIQDAFGALHRAHASTVGLPQRLESAIGFLVQKELEFLDRVVGAPVRPFLAILGGAKVRDKIKVTARLLDRVDTLLIGGGMSFTFLHTQGISIGKSLLELDRLDDAREIIGKAYSKGVELLMPADHWMVEEIRPDAKTRPSQGMAVQVDLIGVDIGPRTIELFSEKIHEAKTIFWNGPMGIFETPAFAEGSLAVARAVAEATDNGATSIVGGGDSLALLAKAGLKARITHASTGGGASLKFMEGSELPGLTALSDAGAG